MSYRKPCRTLTDISPPALMASAEMLSGPVALPLFRLFSASKISLFVIFPVRIGNSGPSARFGGFYGSGRFNTCSK